VEGIPNIPALFSGMVSSSGNIIINNHKQQHIVTEILEDQIQKLLNEDAKKAKSINGLNGKSKVTSKKKETK